MSRRLRHISTFAALAFSLSAASGYYYYQSPGLLSEEVTLVIPRGAGFRGAVDALAEQGVIRHPLLFKALAVAGGQARRFKAGEYAFPAGAPPRQVMEMLSRGLVVPHKFTVAEGLTSDRVLALLAEEKTLAGSIEGAIEEGSLLPETYHFIYGDKRGDLIGRMQRDMAVLVADLWERRREGLPLKTPDEAVTLASIVEKETGVAEERGRIAAVFLNRLRIGMRLQSDPTVAYAIERERGPLEGELTTKDLSYDSPYNTYKYAGLPPGPICNPGRASLMAVLNPPETGDLYFVANGDGGHHFSVTLKSHNDKVREYRKRRKP